MTKYINDKEVWLEIVKKGCLDFSDTFFDGVDFSEYVVNRCTFERCVFNRVNMATYMVQKSNFDNSIFYNTLTGGRYFDENSVRGCTFIWCRFGKQEYFGECEFTNSSFYLSSFHKGYESDTEKMGGTIHPFDASLLEKMDSDDFFSPNKKSTGLVLCDKQGHYLMRLDKGDYINAHGLTVPPPNKVKIVKSEDFSPQEIVTWSTFVTEFELFQNIPQLTVATKFQDIQRLRIEAMND